MSAFFVRIVLRIHYECGCVTPQPLRELGCSAVPIAISFSDCVVSRLRRVFDPSLLLHSSPYATPFDKVLSRVELEKAGGHPERPERLDVIMTMMRENGFLERTIEVPVREVNEEEILAVHSKKFLQELRCPDFSPQPDYIHFYDRDTFANQYSLQAAINAAGGLCELVRAVGEGDIDNGFGFIRPPGHHAEKDIIMGFCLLNNAAIAARYAQKGGVSEKSGEPWAFNKVLILDWDVHHGNGTQNIFYDDSTVMYMSVHKGGNYYPGTGRPFEIGVENGKGFTINCPFLNPGMGDADYVALFERLFIPIATSFSPDLIIVSAGFDCAATDLLGPMKVSSEGFGIMTSLLMNVPTSKLVLALEGGYALVPTRNGVEASMRVLLGENPPALPTISPSLQGYVDILMAVDQLSEFWPVLNDLSEYTKYAEIERSARDQLSSHGPPDVPMYVPEDGESLATDINLGFPLFDEERGTENWKWRRNEFKFSKNLS